VGDDTNRVCVLLVDAQTIFRQGLAEQLATAEGIQVVGEAETAEAAGERARELSPDVVLMSLRLPGRSGVEATREVLAVSPRSRVVMLTASERLDDAERSMRAGASGYVLKQSPLREIVAAIHVAAAGQSPLSPAIAAGIVEAYRAGGDDQPVLTERERAVLEHLVDGRTNPEIAAALGISKQTVKEHVSRLMEKLEASNRTQLAVSAVRRGLA
jgi:two-component system, NarL family, response regulator LiaR